jgi:hypothetical protein
VLGVNVSVATGEDTVLAKVEWSKLGESERQLRDVSGILEVKGESLDVAYVERWLDELGVRELGSGSKERPANADEAQERTLGRLGETGTEA